ncbi:hypothetical protein [Clostridium sp.]|uniref:hypothetical protein n=1 Tax=Clostridium sp. TaxID=1506 RepID=UPI00321673C9
MNKSFNCDKEIKKVVFSTPADKMYVVQSIEIMKAIKEKFPKSELICSFHRVVNSDKFTSDDEAIRMLYMKSEAEKLGFEIEDLSYDLDKMAVYDESDLHIRYRVHAHIYCLRHRVKNI